MVSASRGGDGRAAAVEEVPPTETVSEGMWRKWFENREMHGEPWIFEGYAWASTNRAQAESHAAGA
eukprot:SAG22_NODE_13584_length_401_cov_1.033113_1_plen_65_part_01